MTSSLLILEPPYEMARRMYDVAPDLGSIALLDAADQPPSTRDLKSQMDIAPWCPLCILTERDSRMRSTRRLPRTCVVFGLPEDDGATPILRAVATRPRPTPSNLADWLVKRTKLNLLSRTLSDLFTRPLLRRTEVSFLPYSIRERMRQLGEWGALEWQRAAILADLAADRTALTRSLSADEGGATDVRRWMRDLLGVSERDFHQRYGWEWVLEASLRRSGFFERRSKGVRMLHPSGGIPPAVTGESSKRRAGRRATA